MSLGDRARQGSRVLQRLHPASRRAMPAMAALLPRPPLTVELALGPLAGAAPAPSPPYSGERARGEGPGPKQGANAPHPNPLPWVQGRGDQSSRRFRLVAALRARGPRDALVPVSPASPAAPVPQGWTQRTVVRVSWTSAPLLIACLCGAALVSAAAPAKRPAATPPATTSPATTAPAGTREVIDKYRDG